MKIVPGSASMSLSKELAKELGCGLSSVETVRFPDGECYVKINDDLNGEDVVLVQTTYPDENLVELFILQDAIREFSIGKLTTVVPYYGYARQDKKFKEGEAISARAMAKHIELLSDKIITVDIHAKGILDWFTKPVMDVSGMPQIGEYLKDLEIDFVLSPDKGAIDRAKLVSEVVGCGWDYLEKTRLDGETVKMEPKNIDANGKTVAITDDIIATGGTIIRATEQLKANGARKVYAACTHGLFTNNALDRLQPVCDKVISTDTIENETSVVSAAKEIAKKII